MGDIIKPELYREDGKLCIKSGELSLCADFLELKRRVKPGAINLEPLIKAIKSKREFLSIVDATAGLGEDSFIMAAAGHNVTMFEKDETIAALLEDALIRGADDEEISETIKRMKLIKGDSVKHMKELDFVPDVVLLDPMFPKRTKSALVKKKFQILKLIEPPEADGEALVDVALRTGARKIIIKRPVKGELLGGIKPSYSIDGKSVRWDVIVRA